MTKAAKKSASEVAEIVAASLAKVREGLDALDRVHPYAEVTGEDRLELARLIGGLDDVHSELCRSARMEREPREKKR